PLRSVAPVSAAVIAALVTGGCSGHPVELKSNFSVAQARAFGGFPVYYAGEKVAGLPLTSVWRDPVTAPPGTPVARKLGTTTHLSFGRRDGMREPGVALEGLNVPVKPGDELPAPARGALDGTLPCR